jgi:hypothetical protein
MLVRRGTSLEAGKQEENNRTAPSTGAHGIRQKWNSDMCLSEAHHTLLWPRNCSKQSAWDRECTLWNMSDSNKFGYAQHSRRDRDHATPHC